MIEVMNSFENSAKLFLELMEALAEGNSLNREERKNLKIELENLRELVRSKRREHLIFEDNINVVSAVVQISSSIKASMSDPQYVFNQFHKSEATGQLGHIIEYFLAFLAF